MIEKSCHDDSSASRLLAILMRAMRFFFAQVNQSYESHWDGVELACVELWSSAWERSPLYPFGCGTAFRSSEELSGVAYGCMLKGLAKSVPTVTKCLIRRYDALCLNKTGHPSMPRFLDPLERVRAGHSG
jgi:hypothetical protein